MRAARPWALAVSGGLAVVAGLAYAPRACAFLAAAAAAAALGRYALRRLSPLEAEQLASGHRFNLPDAGLPAVPLRPGAEALRGTHVRRALKAAWRRPSTYHALTQALVFLSLAGLLVMLAGQLAGSALAWEEGYRVEVALILLTATCAGVCMALTMREERGD